MAVELSSVNPRDFPMGRVGKNVSIRANSFRAFGGFEIGDNVTLHAESIFLGDNARIERDSTIKGLGTNCLNFYLGDESLIAFNNQILTPIFRMGDYGQIHNNCLISGYKPVEIGHNFWIGQQSILNSTESLSIGNNVRIGTGSQLWTHVASGEMLEGCTLLGFEPLVLEDNVWVVGGAVISPGLVVRRNSVIMTGSVLTKSTEAFHTYAGVPAKDISDKIKAWNEVDLDWKMSYLKSQVKEFLEFAKIDGNAIRFFDGIDEETFLAQVKAPALVIFKSADLKLLSGLSAQISFFDLNSKTYRKTRTPLEKSFLKFCVGYRARFLPLE